QDVTNCVEPLRSDRGYGLLNISNIHSGHRLTRVQYLRQDHFPQHVSLKRIRASLTEQEAPKGADRQFATEGAASTDCLVRNGMNGRCFQAKRHSIRLCSLIADCGPLMRIALSI